MSRINLTAKFWIYDNFVHKYVSIHRAECSHCNDGKGTASLSPSERMNDEWVACSSFIEAQKKAAKLGYQNVKVCYFCRPDRKETPKELGKRLKRIAEEKLMKRNKN